MVNVDIFKINELSNKKFTNVFITIQLAIIGLFTLDKIGIQLPALFSIVGFFYLTFIPGFIILRLLKFQTKSITKTLIYSMGLSIFFIMAVGLLINNVLYQFSLTKHPLSSDSLTISFSVIVTGLYLLSIYLNKVEKRDLSIDLPEGYSEKYRLKEILLIIFLPIISVIGTTIMNIFFVNTLLLMLFLIIAVFVIAIVLFNVIDESLYPLVIFSIGLSVLFTNSLISNYLLAGNIDNEYYYAYNVVMTGYWDYTSNLSNINTLLSITILGPVYSNFLRIDILWVIKLIYPVILSFTPIIIYMIGKDILSSKKALLAAFFFISIPGYYTTWIYFRREVIAGFFIVLLIMTLLDKNLNKANKTVFSIIFLAALPLSHYGMTYMIYIIILLNIFYLYSETFILKLSGKKTPNFTNISSIFKLNIIFIGIIIMISWFTYVSKGIAFNNYVNIVTSSIMDLKYFFEPSTRPESIYQNVTSSNNFLTIGYRIINYVITFSIIFGLITLVLKKYVNGIEQGYRILLIVVTLFLIGIIILPNWFELIAIQRIFGFSFLFISPVLIIGYENFLRFTMEILSFIKKISFTIGNALSKIIGHINNNSIMLLLIFVILPYFLVNAGVMHEIGEGIADVSGLTIYSPLVLGTNDTYYYNNNEIAGAIWLGNTSMDNSIVYSDEISHVMLTFWFQGRANHLTPDTNFNKGSYIYLRSWNIEKSQFMLISSQYRDCRDFDLQKLPNIESNLVINNRIYNNGGSEIIKIIK